MEPDTLLSPKRQRELIKINRVLAILVVGLAFSTGFLLALRESWFTITSKLSEIHIPETASTSGWLVTSQASPLAALLRQARYDRVITNQPITRMQLDTILWSAQGTITPWGERTVPSYKSAFPLSLYVLVRQVTDVTPGWYWFNTDTQQLEAKTIPGTLLLPETFPGLLDAPIVLFAVGNTSLLSDGMTWNEAGGIAQNILLSTKENALTTFLIPGTYFSSQATFALFDNHQSVYWLMPIGIGKEK